MALTEASYTILIQALSDAGACNEAVKCLDTMESEGLTPNVISYAAAMAASRDKPDMVVELLDRMKKANVTPNTVLLTSAINSLAREGGNYTYKAYAILQDMEERGPEPNIYTYNTVTRAFAEAGSCPRHSIYLSVSKTANSARTASPSQHCCYVQVDTLLRLMHVHASMTGPSGRSAAIQLATL